MLRKFLASLIFLGLIWTWSTSAESQERRLKLRISNAGFTITALPLLAAKDWGIFSANGLDVELIVMAASLAPAALSSGDIDYIAGSARQA
jgi:ABC-type nitrate/sulfonate/bicarbonate transport system substrate-binding protein